MDLTLLNKIYGNVYEPRYHLESYEKELGKKYWKYIYYNENNHPDGYSPLEESNPPIKTEDAEDYMMYKYILTTQRFTSNK